MVKRTNITVEQAAAYKRRDDFVPVVLYASLVPEPGELGSLVVGRAVEETSVGSIRRGGECVERIFVVETE